MATAEKCDVPDDDDLASRAKHALERVCSGAGIEPPSRYYSPSFHDHVNGASYRGLEGVQRSVAMYKRMLPDLQITVEEQICDATRVVSRFVVSGTNRGRRVRFDGITISRFENGLIVEDWSVTNALGMMRQLGLWRTLALFVGGRR